MGEAIDRNYYLQYDRSRDTGVALNEQELAAVNPGVVMSDALHDTLVAWVDKHYRDRLSEADLADPQLLIECRTALDELTQILKLGSVYPFQIA